MGIHLFAEGREVAGEGLVIKRSECHPHSCLLPGHLTREVEEGSQPIPGCMGIRAGKVLIPRPHHQVRQRHLADGHHLIFVVVQLVHLLLTSVQVFQLPQRGSLILAVAFDFSPLGIAFAFRTPVVRYQFFEFGINLRFPLANDPTDGVGIHTLVMQGILLLVQFAIPDITALFAVGVAPICPATGVIVSFAGAICPLLEAITALLQGRTLLGHFRVFDVRFAVVIVGTGRICWCCARLFPHPPTAELDVPLGGPPASYSNGYFSNGPPPNDA